MIISSIRCLVLSTELLSRSARENFPEGRGAQESPSMQSLSNPWGGVAFWHLSRTVCLGTVWSQWPFILVSLEMGIRGSPGQLIKAGRVLNLPVPGSALQYIPPPCQLTQPSCLFSWAVGGKWSKFILMETEDEHSSPFLP